MTLAVERCDACGHEHVCTTVEARRVCSACAVGEDCGRATPYNPYPDAPVMSVYTSE